MNAVTLLKTVPAAAAESLVTTMQAVVHTRYGEPGADVLALGEVARPVPGPEEVLVRVRAAAATLGDHHVVTGKPYAIRATPYGGLPGPKHPVPGQSMAGVVEAVGARVTTLKAGDEVYGQASRGAFAQYLAMPANLLVAKPTNLSFEEAAALPWAATALEGWRVAKLKAGQRVLVNGASGGVGTWAVQLAKAQGAHVTAVCSTRNLEMVRSLGADEVLDYTVDDFVKGGARFDAVFDLVGNRSMNEVRSTLLPKGTWIPCFGGGNDWVGPMGRILWAFLSFLFSGHRVGQFVMSPKRENLIALKELVEAGKGRPIIERQYELSQVAAALQHVGEGHSRGQLVIRIAS